MVVDKEVKEVLMRFEKNVGSVVINTGVYVFVDTFLRIQTV